MMEPWKAENLFLVHNLLWIGFFGETYTGLVKISESAEWEWPAEAGNDDYSCLDDFSDWIDGPAEGCSASFGASEEGTSCMVSEQKAACFVLWDGEEGGEG